MMLVVVEMAKGAAATAMATAEGGELGGPRLTPDSPPEMGSYIVFYEWGYALIDSVGPTGSDFFTVNS